MSLSSKKLKKEFFEKENNSNKNDILRIKKERLKLKINSLDNKIISLRRSVNLKNKIITSLKLENEIKNNEIKIENLKEQYKYVIQKYKKKINSLKINLFKCKKKFINVKKVNESLNNEDDNFQNNKIKLLDELVKYREILSNLSSSYINNSNNDYSSDEKTIRETSFVDYSKLYSDSLLSERNKDDIEYNHVNNKIENFQAKFFKDIKC